MLGLINIVLEAFVSETFGEDAWVSIKKKAGLSSQTWTSGCPYADDQTYK